MKKFLKRSLYITLLMFAVSYAAVIIAGVSPESPAETAAGGKVVFTAENFLEAVGCEPTDGLAITQRDINGAVLGVRVGGKSFTYVELKHMLDLPWDRFDIQSDGGGVAFVEK